MLPSPIVTWESEGGSHGVGLYHGVIHNQHTASALQSWQQDADCCHCCGVRGRLAFVCAVVPAQLTNLSNVPCLRSYCSCTLWPMLFIINPMLSCWGLISCHCNFCNLICASCRMQNVTAVSQSIPCLHQAAAAASMHKDSIMETESWTPPWRLSQLKQA